MTEINVKWPELRDHAIATNLVGNIQSIEFSGQYVVVFVDQSFSLLTRIRKSEPRNPDQIEWEDSYEGLANKNVTSAVVRRLASDSILMNPRTIPFKIPAGKEDFADKKLVSSTGLYSMRGGILYVPREFWTIGDTIAFQIIDKDNILGLGATPEAPIVLNEFIKKWEWSVIPDVPNELVDESISSPLPSGLYCRAWYKSASEDLEVEGLFNIVGYEV